VRLHVIDRDDLLRNIAKARRQTTRETARRGDILDTSGKVRLATSRPMIVVAVDPMLVRPEDEAKLPELARLLDLPLAEVERKFTTKYRMVPLNAAEARKTSATDTAAAAPMLKLDLPLLAAPPTVDGAPATDPNVDPEFAKAIATANDPPPSDVALPKTDGDDDDDDTDSPDKLGRRPIRWAKLSDHVSESTFAAIEKLGIRALCAPERRYARVYPHDEMAAHVVGYADRSQHGVAGIEAFADFYLRGQDGWRESEKDGRRRELAQFQTREIPRADGYSVILSIDSTVQDIIERELQKIAATYQPLKATVIVSRPNTGFILGMANYPTYNPNEYNRLTKDQLRRMRNVAVADYYEPGSVFKIVAASAALEEGLVTEESAFNCGIDRITYKGRELHLPREDHVFGMLTVAEIIAHSSNRGAAQLAMELGEDKFERYARAFGFGSKLGFPIGGESPGNFKPHEKWYPIDITRIPMGQSIGATVLQMHQAMCTMANGGLLMRPQIVRQIRDASDSVVYDYGPAEIDRVVSARTAQRMAKLLQAVASPAGTAPEAAIKINGVDYEVAGKTGTAQKYLPEVQANGRVKIVPSRKHHVVSFVGFFPASRPQVAISVVVDDADAHCLGGVAYGSKVAAPVFKSIGEKLIPILSITPPNQPARAEFVAANEGGRR
jgi:cell division protein FtsI/penicillin-binding protein 2